MQRFGNGLHIREPAAPGAGDNDGLGLSEYRPPLGQPTDRIEGQSATAD